LRSKISEEGVTCLKSYEKESLFKNFLVFFSLLEILLVLLFTELYRTEKREYRQSLFKTMQVCSYTYECPQFTFEFTPKSDQKNNTLYEDDGLYAYFYIPKSDKFNVKISYPQSRYREDMREIRKALWIKFALATILLMGVALFFTFYSLRPIRTALRINDEFIKDILHDFNTPIASMVLNIQMYKETYKSNPFIQRIAHSIDTIMLLQNNLKSFLHHSPSQNHSVDIGRLAQSRMKFMQSLYPRISFSFHQDNPLVKTTNDELLTRILDNLLGNAAKYNRPGGSVSVRISNQQLTIQDTGKGIEDTTAVFERYYKEQERGLGLGLHIVQKLTSELNIGLDIVSKPNEGTTIILDFRHLPKGSR